MYESRILVVSERYWPDGGGGELATHLIVDILRRKLDVTVITGSKNPIQLPGVEYVYEPLLSRWEKPILWLNTLRFVKTSRFEKLVRESGIVYVPRFAFPIIPYAKKMGKRVIVHLHGYIPISYTATVLAPYEEHRRRITRDDIILECMKGAKHCIAVNLLWWLPRLARRWMAQADKIICVSRRQAEIISDLIQELRDKIEVIYNPLPFELVNIGLGKNLDNTPTFLYVGGDSILKGFHILLQVLMELDKLGVKARFILTNSYNCGNLRILKALSEKCKNLEINVMGKVKYEEIINLHKQSWALVFLSIWEEPLPYAVTEAMRMGTIPIATSVGGIPELLQGTAAESLLINNFSSKTIVTKLQTITTLSNNEILGIGKELMERIELISNPGRILSTISQV
jgi:glycosyltransferase involved in cell wall biosynthesis